MNIFDKMDKLNSTKSVNTSINEEYKPKFVSKNKKSWQEYFKMLNPVTGKRYEIPMLKPTDPDYPLEYADMMKFKEINPTGFDAIMGWK